jgi:hypothetical protein
VYAKYLLLSIQTFEGAALFLVADLSLSHCPAAYFVRNIYVFQRRDDFANPLQNPFKTLRSSLNLNVVNGSPSPHITLWCHTLGIEGLDKTSILEIAS